MPRTIENPPFSDVEALTSLITDLASQVQLLRDDVEKTKAAAPTYVPVVPDAVDRQGLTVGLAPGQDRDGHLSRLYVGANSHQVPFRPRFDKGYRVRINPDVTRNGSPESWGDILKRIGCEGYGTIRFVSFLSPRGEWKYQVDVPGLTSRRRAEGFYDSELLPA